MSTQAFTELHGGALPYQVVRLGVPVAWLGRCGSCGTGTHRAPACALPLAPHRDRVNPDGMDWPASGLAAGEVEMVWGHTHTHILPALPVTLMPMP